MASWILVLRVETSASKFPECWPVPSMWLVGVFINADKGLAPPLSHPTHFQYQAGLVSIGDMSVPSAADHKVARHREERRQPKVEVVYAGAREQANVN